jgi:DivIVA domain-containing protein
VSAQEPAPQSGERRVTPADVQHVRFSRGSILNPGYDLREVDRFLNRVGHELMRTTQEKAELRDRLQELQRQLGEASTQAPEPPSDQAVRILASAQLTADNYVAEAEEFSRQITSDARTQYEEQLQQARESAGAIIHAAHEAAARMTREGTAPRDTDGASVEELQEQVAYLKAFGQAVRTQLRSYLEALITDVESEWGKADPGALPGRPLTVPAQRTTTEETPNLVAEVAPPQSPPTKR